MESIPIVFESDDDLVNTKTESCNIVYLKRMPNYSQLSNYCHYRHILKNINQVNF